MPASIFLENAERIATIFALVAGGAWGFFRFIRHRTFKPRLLIKVESNIIHSKDCAYLKIISSASNVGLSVIRINHEHSGIEVLVDDIDSKTVQWQEFDVSEIFLEHEVIEPGETIQDELIIKLPGIPRSAIRTIIYVAANLWFSKRNEWQESSTTLFSENIGEQDYGTKTNSQRHGGKPNSKEEKGKNGRRKGTGQE